MKKISILLSISIVTIVFIYALFLISNNNTCRWVRSFSCPIETNN